MASKVKKLYSEKTKTIEFLLYKTNIDSKKIEKKVINRPATALEDKLIETDYASEILFGQAFINKANEEIMSWSKFFLLAIQIDDINLLLNGKTKNIQKNNFNLFINILNNCYVQDQKLLGQLNKNTFAFFIKNGDLSDCVKIAEKIQKNVKQELDITVSIGITQYPLINYDKAQIVDNALKALDHAAFFGKNSKVVFDATSLNISADELYQNGNVEAAIDEFNQALKLDPLSVNVHNSLGVCYGLIGNHDKALEEFTTTLWLDPEEKMAYFNIGMINLLLGKKDIALEHFLNTDILGNDNFEGIFQTARIYLEMEDLKKAKFYLDKSLEINSESALANRYLGQYFSKVNDNNKAIAAYKKAIKLNPNDAVSLSDLGELYCKTNQNLEVAEAFFKQSIEISPNTGLYHYRLGYLYFNQQKLIEALKLFKKANKLGYHSREIINNLKK